MLPALPMASVLPSQGVAVVTAEAEPADPVVEREKHLWVAREEMADCGSKIATASTRSC